MGELCYHDKLKKWAKDILRELGFSESEILEEYKIKIDKRTTFFVDVVGISEKKKVAIECGLTEIEKIEFLKSKFDDVIVLPYAYFPKVVSDAEQKIKMYADMKRALQNYGYQYFALVAKIFKILRELKKSNKISFEDYDEIDAYLFHDSVTEKEIDKQVKNRINSIITQIENQKQVIPYQNWIWR